MMRRFVFGGMVLLLLVLSLAAIGYFAYQAGVAQGLTASGQLAAPEDAGRWLPPVYAYGPYWPFGFGFGLLGCLFPLFFFFLFFGLLRLVFWKPRWGRGWRRGFGCGWPSHGSEGRGLPPMFEEWHRRAHGEGAESSGQEPPPAQA